MPEPGDVAEGEEIDPGSIVQPAAIEDDELKRQLLDILDKTTLEGVSLVKEELAAEPFSADIDRIELTFFPAEYRAGSENRFEARYTIEAIYIDADDDRHAIISVTHVVGFSSADHFDHRSYDERALSIWLEMNVFFMVYPYMRSAVHAAAARLEIPPLMLGVLPRDAGRPEQMITVPRSGRNSAD